MPNTLESKVHKRIRKFGNVLTSDIAIVKMFGRCAYGTDHVIILDNEIITIQDKWESTSPCIRDISHFIRSTEYIVRESGKKLKYAIFASKLPMTSTGIEIITEENKKYGIEVYKSIHKCRSEKSLARSIKRFLSSVNV